MILLKDTSVIAGVILFVMSSTVKQCDNPSAIQSTCTHTATAKDYTGLDGCGILLVLESGEKLLASNLDEYKPPVQDGEIIRISYEKAEEMMSTCMAEDATVKLTCLTRMSDKQASDDCPVMKDPYAIAWSAKVMDEIHPRQVEELIVDGHRMYRFYAPSGAHIYSCSGELLCTVTYNTQGACDAIEKQTTDIKVIYVVND